MAEWPQHASTGPKSRSPACYPGWHSCTLGCSPVGRYSSQVSLEHLSPFWESYVSGSTAGSPTSCGPAVAELGGATWLRRLPVPSSHQGTLPGD